MYDRKYETTVLHNEGRNMMKNKRLFFLLGILTCMLTIASIARAGTVIYSEDFGTASNVTFTAGDVVSADSYTKIVARTGGEYIGMATFNNTDLPVQFRAARNSGDVGSSFIHPVAVSS